MEYQNKMTSGHFNQQSVDVDNIDLSEPIIETF